MRTMLHIITSLGTGGAERALFNIVTEKNISCKYKSVVISLTDLGFYGPLLKLKGVDVYSLGLKKGTPSFFGFLRLAKLVRQISPDIIQSWMYHANLAAFLINMFFRFPLIWNIRHSLNDFSNEKYSTRITIRLNCLLSPFVRYIVFNSEASLIQHVSFGFPVKTARCIPNGFDIQAFHFSDLTKFTMRKELNIEENCFVIGHVARFHPIKDHKLFWRAAVKAIQKDQRLIFVMVGRGIGPENFEWQDEVPVCFRNHFRLLGERADVEKIMNVFDVLCLSSRSEAFPNVLGEAMAMGLPCVSTEVGDARFIVGDSGVLVPVGDTELLTDGFIRLASMPEKEFSILKVKARERVVSMFSLEQVAIQYAKLIDVVAG